MAEVGGGWGKENVYVDYKNGFLNCLDNYRLGSDINSKVLAFAFGLSAEIERNLISQRTKEALSRKKAEGVILGRPKDCLKITLQVKNRRKI